ncbi:hypothetical protein [Variovorax paradoxus]|uniref:hypothetical protein n=1 Tax=Variovorax paradoxus TaxID=34073 RepID=UPI0024818E5C|nr:hypothetical protein [Variovorax paradoxus]WGT63740.1 hypothetical protein QHG62_27580 [Variovorax paradoxus]
MRVLVVHQKFSWLAAERRMERHHAKRAKAPSEISRRQAEIAAVREVHAKLETTVLIAIQRARTHEKPPIVELYVHLKIYCAACLFFIP